MLQACLRGEQFCQPSAVTGRPSYHHPNGRTEQTVSDLKPAEGDRTV